MSLSNTKYNEFNAENDFFYFLLKDPAAESNFSALNKIYVSQILEDFYNSYKLKCIAYSIGSFYSSYGNCNCKQQSVLCMPQSSNFTYKVGCVHICSD